MKTLTRKQMESRKAQAVRFTRDGWVMRTGPTTSNMNHWTITPNGVISNLKTRKEGRTWQYRPEANCSNGSQELESENEDLQSRLDDIADLVNADSEAEEEGEGGDGNEDDRRVEQFPRQSKVAL